MSRSNAAHTRIVPEAAHPTQLILKSGLMELYSSISIYESRQTRKIWNEGKGGGELLPGLVNCRLSTCCILAALFGWLASGRWWIELRSGWDVGVEREIGFLSQSIPLVYSSSMQFLSPLELFLEGPEKRRRRRTATAVTKRQRELFRCLSP